MWRKKVKQYTKICHHVSTKQHSMTSEVHSWFVSGSVLVVIFKVQSPFSRWVFVFCFNVDYMFANIWRRSQLSILDAIGGVYECRTSHLVELSCIVVKLFLCHLSTKMRAWTYDVLAISIISYQSPTEDCSYSFGVHFLWWLDVPTPCEQDAAKHSLMTPAVTYFKKTVLFFWNSSALVLVNINTCGSLHDNAVSSHNTKWQVHNREQLHTEWQSSLYEHRMLSGDLWTRNC